MRLLLCLCAVALVPATMTAAGPSGGGRVSSALYGRPFVVVQFGDIQHLSWPTDTCTTYGYQCQIDNWLTRGLHHAALEDAIDEVIRTARKENIKLVIFPGDITQTPCTPDDGQDPNGIAVAEWANFNAHVFDRLVAAKVPFISAKGNHDCHGGASIGFAATFDSDWVAAMEAMPGVFDADVYSDGDAHYVAFDCGGHKCIGLSMPVGAWRKSGLESDVCDDTGLMAWIAGIDSTHPSAYWLVVQHSGSAESICALGETSTATWLHLGNGHALGLQYTRFDTTLPYREESTVQFNLQAKATLREASFVLVRFRPGQGRADAITYDPVGGAWDLYDLNLAWVAGDHYVLNGPLTRIPASGGQDAPVYDAVRGPLHTATGGWLSHDACILAYMQGDFDNRNNCANASPRKPYPRNYTVFSSGEKLYTRASKVDGVPAGSREHATAWCTTPLGTEWGVDLNTDYSTMQFLFDDDPSEGGMDPNETLVRPDGFIVSFWAENLQVSDPSNNIWLAKYGTGYCLRYSVSSSQWTVRVGDAIQVLSIPQLDAAGQLVHIAITWGRLPWGEGGTGGNVITYLNGVPQCAPDSDCPIETDPIPQQGTSAPGDAWYYLMDNLYGCEDDYLKLDMTKIDPASAAQLREYVEWIKVCGSDDTATRAQREAAYGAASAIRGPNGETSCVH